MFLRSGRRFELRLKKAAIGIRRSHGSLRSKAR